MAITVSMAAHKTPSETVNIVAVLDNNSGDSIQIGSMTSQLYEIAASSASVARYGQSVGYLQAPHHITVPPNKSVVFSKEYETESYIRDDMGDLDIVDIDDFVDEIACLEPDITETVNATVSIFNKSSDMEKIEESIAFVPSELAVKSMDIIVDELRTNSLTDNSVQLG